MVNNQLIEEENPPISTGSKARRRRTNTKDPLQSLGNRVSKSWRKVTSGELCAYHVQRIHWLRGAQLPLGETPFPSFWFVISSHFCYCCQHHRCVWGCCGSGYHVISMWVRRRSGRSTAPLKELLCPSNCNTTPILAALGAFTSLVLEGRTPLEVHLFFFSATLWRRKRVGCAAWWPKLQWVWLRLTWFPSWPPGSWVLE